MIEHYTGTLSKRGYMVKVNDKNKKLPDGRVVESGVAFRNVAHLDETITADFFVPCGGNFIFYIYKQLNFRKTRGYKLIEC